MAYYDVSLSWYDSDGTQEYIQDVGVTKDSQERIPIIEKTEKEVSETENIPFFNTDGNDIEKLDDYNDDEDEDDKDSKKNDNEKEDDNDKDNDDD